MKKTTKEPRSKRVVRIISLVLAFLMVAGAAYYAIVMIAEAL